MRDRRAGWGLPGHRADARGGGRQGRAVVPRKHLQRCLHLVGAWAAEGRLVLGRVPVADGSHAIAAIPDLLRVLHLAGAVVTRDAAGCQKEIAAQVRRQGGDDLLAVKGNPSALRDAVVAAFDGRRWPSPPGATRTRRWRTSTAGTRSGS